MKPVRFLGNSRALLACFPEDVRRRAGHEIFMIQAGREASDSKPVRVVGPGACEIRIRDKNGDFRVIYVARFAEAVYVLHAFQKRSQRTARRDLELAATRYRQIGNQA